MIFPDKVYYDTKEDKFGNLAAEYSGYAGNVTFTTNTLTVPEQSYIDQAETESYTLSGVAANTSITVYTGASIDKGNGKLTMSGGSATTPDKLKNGDLIQHKCDTAKEYMVVQSSAKQSDGTYQITYIMHEALLHKYPEFKDVFKAGDAIEITGCTTYASNNGSHIIRSLSGRTLTFDKDIFKAGAEAGTVLMERKVPDLTCICECDNRIWGGEGTTIWASALGDPTNFYVYDGLSTDSYAVAVGTDGAFTGCVAYGSTVLFWKEDCVHKVLGNYPAQYEIYTYTVPGVQEGSEKSLCIINETLFYKGRSGVYAYTGRNAGAYQRELWDQALRRCCGRDRRRALLHLHAGQQGKLEPLCVRHDAGRVAAGGRDPRNRLCPAGRRAVLPGRRDRQADENRAGLFRGGAHPVERHPLQDGRDHPRAEGLLQAVPAGGPGGRVLAQGGDQRG